MVQKIATSDNCLRFPEIIPAKIREVFTEKTAIQVDFEQKKKISLKNLQKLPKVAKI